MPNAQRALGHIGLQPHATVTSTAAAMLVWVPSAAAVDGVEASGVLLEAAVA